MTETCTVDSNGLKQGSAVYNFFGCSVHFGDRYFFSSPANQEERPEKGDNRDYSCLVRHLLISGHDASARTNHGVTPLHLAVVDGNIDVLPAFLAQKPVIDAATFEHGITPLHIASALNRQDIVLLLLKHGADRTKTDAEGWDLIHYASQKGFDRMSQIMIKLLAANPRVEKLTKMKPTDSFPSLYSSNPSSCTGSYYSICDVCDFSAKMEDMACGKRDSSTRETERSCVNCSTDEIFGLFDRQKDGKITLAELTEVIEFLKIPLTKPEIEAMVKAVDANGDGVVDYEEFLQVLNRYGMASMDMTAPPSDLPGILFDIFDADGNGFIDRGEIIRVMQNLGEPITNEDLTDMLREADINGDGQIDKSEFRKLFENLKDFSVP